MSQGRIALYRRLMKPFWHFSYYTHADLLLKEKKRNVYYLQVICKTMPDDET